MPFNEQTEYYVVKGWYEASNGLHQGSFYGAAAPPENLLCPQRIVLHGDDARRAAEAAARQPAKVYPEEILEQRCDRPLVEVSGDALNQFQASLGLGPDYKPPEMVYYVCPDCQGREAHYREIHPDTEINEIVLVCPDCGLERDCKAERVDGAGPDNDGLNPRQRADTDEMLLDAGAVSEMTGSGAVAIRPAALQSPTNTSRYGMPDRGGHGHIDNLKRGKKGDSKQVKTGRNIKGSGRQRLKGFGNKFELPTVSQSGGKRGGNQ